MGLPLDGSTSAKSAKIRGAFDQFKVTTDLLKKFYKNKPNFKVSISTLVTKINIKDIENVGKLLFQSKGIYKPYKWSLLKFIDLELGKTNKDKFFISNKEFSESKKDIKKKFAGFNLRFSESPSYIFISADSRILISRGNEYIDLGDFKTVTVSGFIGLLEKNILEKEKMKSIK